MLKYAARYLILRLIWLAVAPLAYLLVFFGICVLIDWARDLGIIRD